MQVDKKQLIRRNLDYYSELEFARELKKLNQEAFFPFKDKGVDIIGIDKQNAVQFYQLKARNFNIRKKVWGFRVDKEKLKKFPDTDNSYWVFCALRIGGTKFDFFKIPFKKLKQLYNARKNNYRKSLFFDIRNKNGLWEFVSSGDNANKILNLNKVKIS